MLKRCYVFSEDSIEFLNVNLQWKYAASAQKSWIIVQLAIPKLMSEPTLIPFSDQIVIGGGEMMPGINNFTMFGINLNKDGSPEKLIWTKPQIHCPLWAYNLPYFVTGDISYFINSCDSNMEKF